MHLWLRNYVTGRKLEAEKQKYPMVPASGVMLAIRIELSITAAVTLTAQRGNAFVTND